MRANSSGFARRPWVCTLIWNCWFSKVGREPMRPAAAWVFWSFSAATMSFGVRP